jgi:hypothetical protein
MTLASDITLAGDPWAHPVLLVLTVGLIAAALGLYELITGTTSPSSAGSGRATPREVRWTGTGLLFIGVAFVLLYVLVTRSIGAPLVLGIVVSVGLAAAAIGRAVQVRRETQT